MELSAVSSRCERRAQRRAGGAKADIRPTKGNGLFVDEVHRFQAQQDSLLPAVENHRSCSLPQPRRIHLSPSSPRCSRGRCCSRCARSGPTRSGAHPARCSGERGALGDVSPSREEAVAGLVRAGGPMPESLTLLEAAAGVADDRGTSSSPGSKLRPIARS